MMSYIIMYKEEHTPSTSYSDRAEGDKPVSVIKKIAYRLEELEDGDSMGFMEVARTLKKQAAELAGYTVVAESGGMLALKGDDGYAMLALERGDFMFLSGIVREMDKVYNKNMHATRKMLSELVQLVTRATSIEVDIVKMTDVEFFICCMRSNNATPAGDALVNAVLTVVIWPIGTRQLVLSYVMEVLDEAGDGVEGWVSLLGDMIDDGVEAVGLLCMLAMFMDDTGVKAEIAKLVMLMHTREKKLTERHIRFLGEVSYDIQLNFQDVLRDDAFDVAVAGTLTDASDRMSFIQRMGRITRRMCEEKDEDGDGVTAAGYIFMKLLDSSVHMKETLESEDAVEFFPVLRASTQTVRDFVKVCLCL